MSGVKNRSGSPAVVESTLPTFTLWRAWAAAVVHITGYQQTGPFRRTAALTPPETPVGVGGDPTEGAVLVEGEERE